MTASPEITALFRKWFNAELGLHYASPCPDDVMGQLVDLMHDIQARLAAAPAANPHDLLLKLFPLILANFEPHKGEHPLMPSIDCSNGNRDLFQAVLDDLARISPVIAEALTTPNPYDQRRAA